MILLTRRRVIATAILCAAVLAGANGALADTRTYKDVLRPNGHERSTAQKFADYRTCGYRRGTRVNDYALVPIDGCMRAHGWALDRVVADQWDRSPQVGAPSPEYRKYDPEIGGWMRCHRIFGGIGEECDSP